MTFQAGPLRRIAGQGRLDDAKKAAQRLWGQGLLTVIVGRAPQAAAQPAAGSCCGTLGVPWPETPAAAVLDYVANPRPDALYLVRFAAPEFTSLCPVTGQPDFAHFVIDYAPRGWIAQPVASASTVDAKVKGKMAKGVAGGNYTVTAKVTDPKMKKNGDATCTANYTVKEPPKDPPTLACSADPPTVQAGTPSTIGCTCTSPDNVPVTISGWTASANRKTMFSFRWFTLSVVARTNDQLMMSASRITACACFAAAFVASSGASSGSHTSGP